MASHHQRESAFELFLEPLFLERKHLNISAKVMTKNCF